MKPALSPEEWASIRWPFAYIPEFQDEERHRKMYAALALYGQPFGFTWEDVDELRFAVGDAAHELQDAIDDEHERDCRRSIDRRESLADRIAALLPPREETP